MGLRNPIFHKKQLTDTGYYGYRKLNNNETCGNGKTQIFNNIEDKVKCIGKCDNNSECKAFTYNNKKCTLHLTCNTNGVPTNGNSTNTYFRNASYLLKNGIESTVNPVLPFEKDNDTLSINIIKNSNIFNLVKGSLINNNSKYLFQKDYVKKDFDWKSFFSKENGKLTNVLNIVNNVNICPIDYPYAYGSYKWEKITNKYCYHNNKYSQSNNISSDTKCRKICR